MPTSVPTASCAYWIHALHPPRVRTPCLMLTHTTQSAHATHLRARIPSYVCSQTVRARRYTVPGAHGTPPRARTRPIYEHADRPTPARKLCRARTYTVPGAHAYYPEYAMRSTYEHPHRPTRARKPNQARMHIGYRAHAKRIWRALNCLWRICTRSIAHSLNIRYSVVCNVEWQTWKRTELVLPFVRKDL